MLIGRGQIASEIKKFIHKVSSVDHPVIILGESGVGKTFVAHLIHQMSKRKYRPFIHQNCSNIQESLFESEFFGHEKGAFTGAVEKTIGKVEMADGGTLFLDEVSNLSFQNQAKLLMFLENGMFFRLGGKQEIKKDVRIIAATNKRLYREMKEGRFRIDLYYRLNTLCLHIPSLRHRREDIPLFVEAVLREENCETNRNKRMTKDAMEKLLNYHYPGNIRELENIIKRAHTLSDGNEIRAGDIELDIQVDEYQSNIPERLFVEMVQGKKSFWDIVHKSFLRRELNRREVKEIIALGLRQSGGSYKGVMSIFNIGDGVKDYKKFMDMIRIYKLK